MKKFTLVLALAVLLSATGTAMAREWVVVRPIGFVPLHRVVIAPVRPVVVPAPLVVDYRLHRLHREHRHRDVVCDVWR
jgi:hypothetical protein